MSKSLLYILFVVGLLSMAGCGGAWEGLYKDSVKHMDEGKYEDALTSANRALLAAEKEFGPESGNYSQTASTISEIYYYLADYGRSIEYARLDSTIRFKSTGPESNEYAEALKSLGLSYLALGYFSDAESLLTRSLEIRRNLYKSDNADLANSLNNLGYLYYYQGKYMEAEPLFREALDMRRRLFPDGSPDLARSINNLAVFYENVGNWGEAEQLYIESLEMRRKILPSNSPLLAVSIDNLAGYYFGQGKLEQAEKLFKEALEKFKAQYPGGSLDLATCQNNIGLFYLHIGNFTKAEANLRAAMDYRKEKLPPNSPETAVSYFNMASLFHALQQFDEADKYFKASLDIRKAIYKHEHIDVLESLIYLANNYTNRGMLDSAEPYFQNAMKISMKMIKEHFSFMSQSEKTQYWATLSIYFELFNSFAVSRMKDNPSIIKDMFNYVLETKGILLKSEKKIREKVFQTKDKNLIAKYKQWKDLKQKETFSLTSVYDNLQSKSDELGLDTLLRRANQIEKELSRSFDFFSNQRDNESYTWDKLLKKLDNDEAAIEMIRFRKYGLVQSNYGEGYMIPDFTDSVYYAALIVSPKFKVNPQIVILDQGYLIETFQLKRYAELVNKMKFNSISEELSRKTLADIYDSYWKKIADALPKVKTIYFSADGVYNKINLNTLYNPESKKYLIEENDIRLVTSARDLFKKKNKGQSKNYAVLLGDPKFDEHKAFYAEKKNEVQIARVRSSGDPSQLSFEQLPGAKKEVEKINTILQKRKWKTELLTGEAATEEKIKTANNPKVLHIATHGCFLDLDDHHSFDTRESHKFFESPMLGSFLVLSGSKVKGRPNPMADEENVDLLDDGFLTAYEAMNLDLENTELVVLSACETALGEVRNGEGVYGLQRAFLAAGVSTIIMSLWPVDDESTRDLMVKFYENWSSGTNVRTAFRKAQLELKQKKPEFYYWGGFVIAGE